MPETRETFEGWAILELMGHRRLAGYIRQAEQFGAAMLRLDVPENPWREGCTCKSTDPQSLDHEDHTPDCQMFREGTEPADVHATQFYGGASIYCLTPVTEKMARAVSAKARPTPVAEWELRRALPSPPEHDDEILDALEADLDERDHDDELADPF